MENIPRKRGARKLDFGHGGGATQGNKKVIKEGETYNENVVQEIDIAQTMWAIRRPTKASNFTCQGMLHKVGKCKKRVFKGKNLNPAPCFLGMRQWVGKSNETWVWCCSDDVTHVWNICPYIVMKPPRDLLNNQLSRAQI